MTRLQEDKIFASQELSLVAALVSWGFPIFSVERSDPKRIIFAFDNSPELQDAVQDFWDDSGVVSPKKYFSALREIKSRIYGGGNVA